MVPDKSQHSWAFLRATDGNVDGQEQEDMAHSMGNGAREGLWLQPDRFARQKVEAQGSATAVRGVEGRKRHSQAF
jgi:hypothetical protein